MESTLRQYNNPGKTNRRVYWPLCYITVRGYDTACQCKCKQSPVYGDFWLLLPHLSTDRNKTWTWSSLPPRCIKFGANLSKITQFFSYRGHRQTHTHTQTNADKYIFPRFRGDNKNNRTGITRLELGSYDLPTMIII